MKKLIVLIVSILLIGVQVYADDVTIDGNGNIYTGFATSSNLQVTGASGEDAISGTASGTGVAGVYGINTIDGNYGILGYDNYGVYGNSATGWAGYFQGHARVTGNLTVDGSIIGAGDITGVSAGTGITGGGTSGDVTVNVDFGGTGSADTASRSDHTHSGGDITSGAVLEVNIDPAVARDSEIMPAVLANDGVGSEVDADFLDGQHASDIIAAAADEVRTPVSACQSISSSGSYYLTGDIVATGTCISVSVDNVTIDMMGFTVSGPGTYSSGIYINDVSNVEIKNGTVENFTSGIALPAVGGSTAHSTRIINVRVFGNSTNGIFLASENNLIMNCTASNNGRGIYVQSGSTVTGNTVYNNQGDGIYVQSGSTVTKNTVYNNQGLYGIIVSNGSTVINNTSHSNQGYGIYITSGTTVIGNTAYNNQYNGIYLSYDNLVDENTAYNNNQVAGEFTNIRICASCTFGLNHAP